jgi:mevalonate kinase
MYNEPLKLRSNGKILLTGEYTVMKGAKALSLPVEYGQTMLVKPVKKDYTEWKTYLKNRSLMLYLRMTPDLEKVIEQKPAEAGNEIIHILRVLKKMNPHLFKRAYQIETRFEFDIHLGLGASSTLIANLSKWAQVNPFSLLDATFNGSGVDVVTSLSGKPLVFQRTGFGREWQFVDFKPPFGKNLFFVYLNKKQPTIKAVQKFKNMDFKPGLKEEISRITEEILQVKDLSHFNELIEKHDELTGKAIRQRPVKKRLFPDFPGGMKSLGAWGGDLILVTGNYKQIENYFKEKGYPVIFKYNDLIAK